MFINIAGRVIDVTSGVVMSILNITPDSFYSDSRLASKEQIIYSVSKAIRDGASIIDVGGYSSRPGADDVSAKEEIRRLLFAVGVIREEFGDIPLSIDTFRGEVARAVVSRFGTCAINDITAFEADSDIVDVVGEYSLPYIIMHMQGMPQDMQSKCVYGNMLEDIIEYFVRKIDFLNRRGIYDVIIDPGFGFSKTLEQNFELMASLHRFKIFDLPLLVGISRKSMICKTLDVSPQEALNGTTALNFYCLNAGCNILRVHDTLEAMQAVKLYKEIKRWSL